MNTAMLLCTVLCALPLATILVWTLIKFRFRRLPAGRQSEETLGLAMTYLIATAGIAAVGFLFADWRLVAGLSALVIGARATYALGAASKSMADAAAESSETLVVGRPSGANC